MPETQRKAKVKLYHDAQTLAPHLKHIKNEHLHETKEERGTFTSKALHVFDLFMGLVIVFNVFVMIIDIDQSVSDEVSSDGSTKWVEVFGWVVLAIFAVELSLRISVFRGAFWKDPWNQVDFIVVVTDVCCSFIGLFVGSIFPISILRLFRLSKLARVSKLLQVFPELKMLLTGLVHSVRTVFWGVLLLVIFMLVSSMLAVLVIHPLNETLEHPESCDRCARAFSSVFQACLTLWMQVIIGDGWVQFSTPVIEKYPASIFYFLPVYLTMGLAVMNLILAVVVNRSQTAYQEVEELQDAKNAVDQFRQTNNIIEICSQMDTDGSGELSFDELHVGLSQPGEFREAMLNLGVTDADFEVAWTVLDVDKSGTVSYKEFVIFLSTMMTSNSEFLLHYIKNHITWLKNHILLIEAKEDEANNLANKLEETMEKVEKEEENILEEENKLKKAEDEVENQILHRKQQELEVHHDQCTRSKQGRPPSTEADIDLLLQTCDVDMHPSESLALEASIQDATEHLTEQLGNDVGRMHVEFKDTMEDMQRFMFQPSMQRLSSDAETRHIECKRVTTYTNKVEHRMTSTKLDQGFSAETFEV